MKKESQNRRAGEQYLKKLEEKLRKQDERKKQETVPEAVPFF